LSFTVLLHPRAAKSLKKLQTSIRNRILESLKKLEQRPEKGDQMKPSQFWKLLVGDYRVIYEVNQQTSQIIVLHVGHRKKVYDEFSRLF
jgi:mRNA interferase RelE/StbE